MADWVWAIDENGKPCKCTAKPENRGKRNCKHKFHAMQGESQKDFFKKFGYNKTNPTNQTTEVKEYSLEDLPDCKEIISKSICIIDADSKTFKNEISKLIENNPYTHKQLFEGVDVKVSEEIIEDDKLNVELTFIEKNGDITKRDFTIPTQNELGEFNLKGISYRFIPSFRKDKVGVGVEMGAKGTLVLKDNEGENVLFLKKDSDVCTLNFDKDIPISEVEKHLAGEESNLTKEQKEALERLHPEALEKFNKLGLSKMRELPPTDINDINTRIVWTYKDEVLYSLNKNLCSMDSVYRKKHKLGKEQDFNTAGISNNIIKDLVGSSRMQLADDLNPIAAISQSQRITWTGPSVSWNGDKLPNSLREIHPSYYGAIDPADTPVGGKIGLSVAVKGRINPKTKGVIKDESVISGSDFIPYLNHSDPTRSTMAVCQMKEACPIVGGEDPKVSTKGWDKIKGSKLGCNLNVAYIPEAGVWEDAVIISESTAKKMTTVQTHDYNVTEDAISVHVGDKVNQGDNIAGVKIKYPGKVKSIRNGKIVVESSYPMTVGDKLSGRHGNKGVVSKILPDDQMPTYDGKKADVIMSPIGVSGRANLGQVLEVNDGDLNKTHKVSYKNHEVEATAGTQFIMRLNQIAEKKLISTSNEMNYNKQYGARLGEMESIVLSTNENRLEILNYLKHQEKSDSEHKFLASLHSLGVDLK